MWGYLSFFFLFLFVGLFTINVNYAHVNEVFNNFSHSYVATLTYYHESSAQPVFDSFLIEVVVEDYFVANMNKTIAYTYEITYYYDEDIKTKFDIVNNFTINLQGDIGFFVHYNKTFRYRIV